jgi:hypothetical protein
MQASGCRVFHALYLILFSIGYSQCRHKPIITHTFVANSMSAEESSNNLYHSYSRHFMPSMAEQFHSRPWRGDSIPTGHSPEYNCKSHRICHIRSAEQYQRSIRRRSRCRCPQWANHSCRHMEPRPSFPGQQPDTGHTMIRKKINKRE